ncbi:hypothetical protein [Clostridium thermobutyricum]|uniref:hypothetical protein n=1 Tax=Clostridium thermobutyricum TaxID=29372 RepID=UPI0018AA0E2B|nr:hypothetical protein [Clostridium thermobutyricum]
MTVSKDNPKPVIKEVKVTVVVKTADSKVLLTEAPTEGQVGSEVTSSVPTIPVGYKLFKITNNGNEVNGLPSKYDNGTQNVIYVVEKISIVNKTSISTVTKDTNGKILVGESTVTGEPGTTTGLGLDITNGYHLVSITDNGKTIKEMPSKFGKTNENIVVTVTKDAPPVSPKHDSIQNKDNILNPKNTNKVKTDIKNSVSKVNKTVTQDVPNIPVVNTQNQVTPDVVETPSNNNPVVQSYQPVPLEVNNSSTVENPKTGDSSELPFVAGIVASLAALVGININRKKPSINKESKED